MIYADLLDDIVLLVAPSFSDSIYTQLNLQGFALQSSLNCNINFSMKTHLKHEDLSKCGTLCGRTFQFRLSFLTKFFYVSGNMFKVNLPAIFSSLNLAIFQSPAWEITLNANMGRLMLLYLSYLSLMSMESCSKSEWA